MTQIQKDFLLLQINDSMFPIGSFHHSFGLESYVQYGIITTKGDLLSFMELYVQHTLLYNDLLLISTVFKNFKNITYILELESLMCALSSIEPLRNANLKLGRRFCKTIETLKLTKQQHWAEYYKRSIYPTHASAYGMFCASYALQKDMSLRAYLYTQSSNLITNALKIMPLAQDDGQEIIHQLIPTFETALQSLATLTDKSLGRFSPMYDIYSNKHGQLHTQMFMS